MADDDALGALLAEREIRGVLARYCRGADRRDFELMRSCYHPDATDSHGEFEGGVDAFIDYATAATARYERTMHFLGTIVIDVDVAGGQALSESYVLAFHRAPASRTKPQRDITIALRYLDRFERREAQWRIAARRCVFEWTRTDPVPAGWTFPADYLMGVPGPGDPVHGSWR